MQTQKAVLLTCVFASTCLPNLLAQEVLFDIVPTGTTAVPSGTTPTLLPVTVQVLPGATVSYQIEVFVQPTPAQPSVNGLAAFDINILTDLGVTQIPMDAFNATFIQSFAGQSLGTSSGQDILNISATQNLTGITNTGVALGARQIIGTGRLQTPATVGNFNVTLTGTASVLNTGINPSTPSLQPANVATTGGLLIQTRNNPSNGGTTPTTQPTNQELNNFGASLVNLCFPGAAAFLPFCMAGLIGMHWCFRKVHG